MKNEPVAWMLDYEISGIQGGEYRTNPFRHKNPRWDGNYEIREVTNAIPLYTHPVKEQEPDLYSEDGFPLWTSPQFKELTDEEIMEVFNGVNLFTTNMVDVARAILRKAREK
jgi:hypothetical protein